MEVHSERSVDRQFPESASIATKESSQCAKDGETEQTSIDNPPVSSSDSTHIRTKQRETFEIHHEFSNLSVRDFSIKKNVKLVASSHPL